MMVRHRAALLPRAVLLLLCALPWCSAVRAQTPVSNPSNQDSTAPNPAAPAAPVPLKAMLLLGVNCGLGNHDIAMLPLSALDLDSRWLKFPRPKTGIQRRCPLWPETVEALTTAIAERTTAVR